METQFSAFRTVSAVLAMLACIAMLQSGRAEEGVSFAGKTIKMVVGFGPGSGVDLSVARSGII